MKQSLAEQARRYMEWRSQDGVEYTPAFFAADIAKHQTDLPADDRCKRQNIEQLLAKDFKNPHYLVAMAAVMGTTAEDLKAGRYTPPGQPAPPIEAPADPTYYIPQFDFSGGMDTRGRLVIESAPAGSIKSLRVDPEWLRLHVPVYTSLQNLCIVTGFGPSMKGMFNPGDPLLMDRGVHRVDHEGVYFFRVGDEGYIKILQRVPEFDGPGFRLRVISKNEDYPPYDLSPRNPHLHIIGKILTVWKSEQY